MINIIILPVAIFLSLFYQYYMSQSIVGIVLIGIPHCIITYIAVHYLSNVLHWQILYFCLICYYMKYKIFIVNKNLEINSKSQKIFKIRPSIDLIKSLNSFYMEINEYNNNYWSKFLFLIWITFFLIIDSLIYSTLFGEMNLLNKMLFINAVIGFSSILTLVLSIASSVNSEANKSYILLNSLVVSYSRTYSNKTMPQSKRLIKV